MYEGLYGTGFCVAVIKSGFSVVVVDAVVVVVVVAAVVVVVVVVGGPSIAISAQPYHWRS